MRDAMNLSFRLLVIALVAGLLLGASYFITKEPIALQTKLASEAARSKAYPGDFTEDTAATTGNVKAVYAATDGTGYILEVTSSGYGGAFLVTVGVTAEGEIRGVVVGDNSETPGLGKNAQNEDFTGQFVGRNETFTVNEGGEGDVDALTGATITTRAVADAVNEAREYVRGLEG